MVGLCSERPLKLQFLHMFGGKIYMFAGSWLHILSSFLGRIPIIGGYLVAHPTY